MHRHVLSCLVPLVTLLALADTVRAADDNTLAMRTAAALYDGIQTAELPNGLRIFLKPIEGSPSVTTMVVYKVGSCDEDKSFTGLAHYLEHLLFKGTTKLKPGDIDRLTFRSGGSNNAYTSHDITAYHFTFPAGRWKEALEVEADRMRNVLIDKDHEFDKEKGAVIAELARNEDGPWDLEYKALLPRLFGKDHPYGHPVIGERKHVHDATEKVIKDYYDRWYHPNNAALVIAGGFDPAEAMKEIKRLFSDIPKGKLPARKEAPAKGPKLPARYEMESKFSQPRLLIGFPSIKAGDADQPALAVLEGVLSSGKRSRLYRALVEGGLASSASADNTPGRYPGWMGVYVEVLPGKDRAAVEKLVLAELAKVRDKPVDDAELKRVKQLLLSAAVFRREGTYGLADSIGQAVTLTDLESARKFLPRVFEVTAADVQRVAKKYLDPEKSATVWSVPPDKKVGMSARGEFSRDAQRSASGHALHRQNKAGTAAFDLSKTQRVVLENGLVVILFENKRLPIFEARALLRESSLVQPDDKLGVAPLTATLLDEGTSKRTGAQIAETIEGLGATLSAATGTVRSLSTDRKLALEILLECLTQPSFPDDAFKRAQTWQLAEISENDTLPETRAQQLFRATIYGKSQMGRPSPGTEKTSSGLKREDCVAFHKKVFVPTNAILVLVGDFDSKEMLGEVKRLTESWKKVDAPKADVLAPTPPDQVTQKVISMPQAGQLQMFLGHLGIKRNDPDYYKLLVMDHILGTGPGFTDRLSSRLRDREGLAYTVTGNITTTAGLHRGLFSCYIGTEPENFALAKKLLLEEINRIRTEKVSATELADAKAYLTGSQTLAFGTNTGIAAQLLNIERYNLGFGYLADYQKAVNGVTADDILAVAKKHIDPEKLVLVAAGPIDAKGAVLKKEKGK